RAAVTALATMFGMSCHLRSRNTRTPRATNSRMRDGPSRANNTEPIFTHWRLGSRPASAVASRPLGRSSATISSAMVELARNPHGYARIGEGGRPDRDEGRARREVLARIGGVAHTTHADDRHVHVFAHAPRREHADRQERGTAESAAAVTEPFVEQSGHRIH